MFFSQKSLFFILSQVAKVWACAMQITNTEKNGAPQQILFFFFGPTEISGRLCGRRSQNLAWWKIIVGLAGIFKDFLFKSKTKKLCHFKVSQFEIFENMVAPPPFETNAHVRNTFTWHENDNFWVHLTVFCWGGYYPLSW